MQGTRLLIIVQDWDTNILLHICKLHWGWQPAARHCFDKAMPVNTVHNGLGRSCCALMLTGTVSSSGRT